MNGTKVREMLGRRLRLGVIGGGEGALIGPVHRAAARFDDQIEITAGVLSSNPERSMAFGRTLGIPRCYGDVSQMLAAEARHPDGIDAVSISTPNDSHFDYAAQALRAGLDVICDKPLTNDLASARALGEIARASGCVFVLTHNYSGYPMVREARAAVRAGELGPLRIAKVTYVQGSLGTRIEDRPQDMPARTKWRLDPARGGASHIMGDIGTHAHQLLNYVASERITAVMADVGAAIPGRSADDTGCAILRLEGGARGVMLVTKAATGAENAMTLELYGEAGGLIWEHRDPNVLRILRHNRPSEVRTRGLPTNHPAARRATRLPAGHPEAFFEAFANLYVDFAELVAARLSGQTPDPFAQETPGISEGIEGLAFIDACLRSTAAARWEDIAHVG